MSVVLVISTVFHSELEKRQASMESPSTADRTARLSATILGMPFRVSEYMPRDCFGLETASGIEIFRMEHVRSTVDKPASETTPLVIDTDT